MNQKTPESRANIDNMDDADRGAELLPSGDPKLIAKIAKAITENTDRVEMRFNIKDEDENFIDNFVTDVAPVVGDFIELKVRKETTSYEVVARRLLLNHFDDTETKLFTKVRSFEIIARRISN